jgi:hypothetical protein
LKASGDATLRAEDLLKSVVVVLLEKVILFNKIAF